MVFQKWTPGFWPGPSVALDRPLFVATLKEPSQSHRPVGSCRPPLQNHVHRLGPRVSKVTPPPSHLSEIYQIPTLRQEKKCFIYKPIRVFADNCECQILGRDDKMQRLLGPELEPEGWGLLGCPATSVQLRGQPGVGGGGTRQHLPTVQLTKTCLLRASTKELIHISIHRVLSLVGSARRSQGEYCTSQAWHPSFLPQA